MSDQAKSRPKRPKDVNELAKGVVAEAVGESADEQSGTEKSKDPAAVSLGRRGGLKGGKARAKVLSAEDRRRIASLAARKRWGEAKGEDEE